MVCVCEDADQGNEAKMQLTGPQSRGGPALDGRIVIARIRDGQLPRVATLGRVAREPVACEDEEARGGPGGGEAGGFRVQGLGFGVESLGLRVWGLGFGF